MNRRADHWLPCPVFTQYLPRRSSTINTVEGQICRLECDILRHIAAGMIPLGTA